MLLDCRSFNSLLRIITTIASCTSIASACAQFASCFYRIPHTLQKWSMVIASTEYAARRAVAAFLRAYGPTVRSTKAAAGSDAHLRRLPPHKL